MTKTNSTVAPSLQQSSVSAKQATAKAAPAPPVNSSLSQLQAQGNQSLAQLDALTVLGIQDTELEAISQGSLYQPLMKQVLYKFGVGRSSFRRSAKLNEFRDGLKKAARDQAAIDVAAQVDANSTLTGKSDISKTYYKLLANVESHSLAKVSVDHIMEQESKRIIERLVPASSVLSQMKQAVLARHNVPQSQSTAKQLEKEKKAALTTAQDKAKQLLEQFSEIAVNEARVITKGDKFVDGSTRDQQRVDELTQETREHVTSDEVGRRSVALAVESKTIDSGFSKISPVIQQAIPYEGDEASLDFKLKIPVASNAFVLIELGAEAANEGEHIELGSQINVGAGGSIGIAELSAKIGLFLEASGSSISSALTLISYGMYRHMNAGFPTIAQRLWGLNGKTGLSSMEEAELWAAAVETEHLSDAENFVSVGQQVGVDAELETGIYKGELSLLAQRYTKYNKENMEQLANAINAEEQAKASGTGPTGSQAPNIVDKVILFGDTGDRSTAKLEKKAKLLNTLSTYKKFTVSAENKLDFGAASLAFSGEGSLTYYKGHKDQLEASIGVDLPDSISGFDGWSTITEKVIPKVLETAGTIHGKLSSGSQNSQGNASQGGSSQEEADSFAALRKQLETRSGQLADSLSDLSGDSVETESGLAVTFSFEKNWENGAPKDWKVGLDIAKKYSMKLSAGALELEYERSRKMMSLDTEDGLKFYKSKLHVLNPA